MSEINPSWARRIEDRLDKLVDAVTKLARVEEKQLHHDERIGWMGNTVRDHENRIRKLELTDAENKPMLALWMKVVIAVVSGGGAATVLLVGFRTLGGA